jgi:D-sedoheptulose 7-phosphate isomerase
LCLTTSGGSKVKKQTKNIVKAIEYAKKNKIFIISLTGRTGGFAKRNSHLNININSKKTSYIQEAHMSILHCICEQLEKEVN